MGVFSMLGGLFSMVGSGFSALMGFKQQQSEVVKSAIDVLGQTNSSNAQREAAIAQIISAEMSSGYWLSAVWRPMTMVIFLMLILAYWFGYVPPNITGVMPPAVDRMFDLVTLGLGGYIPARTIEKIVSQFNIAGVLKTLIEKKVV